MRKLLALCLSLTLLTGLWAIPATADETVAASSVITVDTESSALINNIDLATESLDGVLVAEGETFSFNNTVGPRTNAEGYQKAVNGRGVKVMGGGVSEVATVLYLALQELDGIDYQEKEVYGEAFTGDYVFSGDDAIITDYDEEIDFSFANNYQTFRISLWRDDADLNCLILTGMEYTPEEGSEDSGDEDFSDDDANGSFSEAGQSSVNVSGTDALLHNISEACNAIDGLILDDGDTFSFNDTVGPRTEARGYEIAVNGRGVKVVGGGVAQVASALWLAAKDMDGITITKKYTYGDKYNQSYVDDPDDAILTDYVGNIDFRFRNDTGAQITLHTELQDDESIICEITGD